MSKKVVFFQGAFDIINAGHIKAFKRARSLGDTLIVALNTDSLLPKYKRASIIPYEQRREILSSIKYIDKIIPINTFGCLPFLKKYKADVFVLTREWESSHSEEIRYMKEKGGRVSFSPRFKNILCSSDIRNKIIESWKKQH